MAVLCVSRWHAGKSPKRGVLRATTTEVIQEFVHRDAARIGRAYAALLSPLLQPSEQDLSGGLRLFERHEELGAFDAVLAAAALGAESDALVSADRSFALVRELRFVELGSSELDDFFKVEAP